MLLSNGGVASYDAAVSSAAGANTLVFQYTVAVNAGSTGDLQVSGLDLHGTSISGISP